MTSNYEKQVYKARELFLNYSQQTMIDKFQISHDHAYLYMKLLDGNYRISRTDGSVEQEKEEGFEPCIDYQVVMALYDVLCCSAPHPVLSGRWCPLASLQTAGSPSADRFTAECAAAFSGKVSALRAACESLGGMRQSVPASADACYRIALLPFFPVIFQFWEGDEEFAPRIMLLWDEKSLDFIHFETLYYVMGHFLERLKALLSGEY